MPLTLCYDWQMGSIPLVERLTDVRNIGTGLFYLYLVGLAVALLWRSHSVSCKDVTYMQSAMSAI